MICMQAVLQASQATPMSNTPNSLDIHVNLLGFFLGIYAWTVSCTCITHKHLLGVVYNIYYLKQSFHFRNEF